MNTVESFRPCPRPALFSIIYIKIEKGAVMMVQIKRKYFLDLMPRRASAYIALKHWARDWYKLEKETDHPVPNPSGGSEFSTLPFFRNEPQPDRALLTAKLT